MMKVAIVGGGQGGLSILTALADINTVQVMGVADIRQDAPAFKLAKELGVPTTADGDSLITRRDLQVIFEVTGRADVLERVHALKQPSVQVVGAEAASVMMEIISSRSKLQAAMKKRAEELEQVSDQVSLASNRIANAMSGLQSSSSELAASGQNLASSAAQTEVSLGEVEEVLEFIRQVANKTRMIGLNAAIEAARVGEQGRGFAVVASEVRKLAQTSNESAESISKSLHQTLDSVKAILQGVRSAHQVAEGQASAASEVNGAVQQLATMVNQLSAIAQQLAKSK